MTSTTPFALGFFSSNPNGNDSAANLQFEQQYNEFTELMDARPTYMDGFVDYSQDPSQWAGNASWTAWSWAQTGANYVGPTSGTVPVIGIPMASTANGMGNFSSVDDFYKQISAGHYDADYAGIVQAWASQGYDTMQARIGYEFNGNFMPWGPGSSSSPTVNADFVAAWQHIADVMHQAGAQDGITVQTVWNPDSVGWNGATPSSLYPGDQYVDIIGVDSYSPTYPDDLTNYTKGGAENGQASDPTTWAESDSNRTHWWQYPDANQYNPTGTGQGWSLADSIALAKETGKPLAIEETGAGGNGTTTGPNDDPAFVQWLAGALTNAQAQGVTIQNVNIWSTDQSDGDWGYLGGEKPEEAQAWSSNFGAPGASAAAQFAASGSSDMAIAAPSAKSAASGAQTTIAGVSISDPWSASQPGNITLTLQASAGKLTMKDAAGHLVTSSGTPKITVTDTLANLDRDLATLTYRSAAGGADTITITAVNQAGYADQRTISVNGGKGPAGTVNTGSHNPIHTVTTPPTPISNDLAVMAPGKETAPSGVQEAFTGVSISDPWGQTQTGKLTVVVKATGGVLSMTTATGALVAGSGTGSISLTDTLAHINADLTTLAYTSTGGGPDVVSITATNQAGVTVHQAIGVNGAPVGGSGGGGTGGSGGTPPGVTPISSLRFTDSMGVSLKQAVTSSGSLDTYGGDSGLDNNVHQWVDGNGVHEISTDAWAYVTTVGISDNTGASFATTNFAVTNASMSNGPTGSGAAATLTVNGSQRGTIALGGGNYNVNFTASNAWGTAAENTVTATMGAGTDNFVLAGSNGLTRAVLQAGAGADRMSFIGTNSVDITGGAGNATVMVTNGGGHDTYTAGAGTLTITDPGAAAIFTFHAGDGLMTINDFAAAQGDALHVDNALLATMQQSVQSGAMHLTFGADAQHGIVLNGVTSLPQSCIVGV